MASKGLLGFYIYLDYLCGLGRLCYEELGEHNKHNEYYAPHRPYRNLRYARIKYLMASDMR